MKEFLRKLGITQSGHYSSNNNYVIDLDDSKDYDKICSALDKSDLVEENPDSSVINTSISNILYVGEQFSLNVIADFDNDTYKVVVTELKEGK